MIKVLSKYLLAQSRNATQTFLSVLKQLCQEPWGPGEPSSVLTALLYRPPPFAQAPGRAVRALAKLTGTRTVT